MFQGVMIGFEMEELGTAGKMYTLENIGEIQLCVGVLQNRIGSSFGNFLLKLETSDHSARTYNLYIYG